MYNSPFFLSLLFFKHENNYTQPRTNPRTPKCFPLFSSLCTYAGWPLALQNVATDEECLKQANSLIMLLKADVRALNACAARLLVPSGASETTTTTSEVARRYVSRGSKKLDAYRKASTYIVSVRTSAQILFGAVNPRDGYPNSVVVVVIRSAPQNNFPIYPPSRLSRSETQTEITSLGAPSN